MKFFWVFFLLFSTITVFSQEIAKEFDEIYFEDDFGGAQSQKWTQTFNIDNLFVRQNQRFDLIRRNKETGYFVIPEEQKTLSSFKIEAGFELTNQSKATASGGIILMANPNPSSGILVEVNSARSYRVMKINAEGMTPISSGKEGWVKNTRVLSKKYNEIVVVTHEKVYDLYINQRYLLSFTDIELNKGSYGLYVGPQSRASFDYIRVLTSSQKPSDEKPIPDPSTKEESTEDLALTQIIIRLRNELAQKNVEIDQLQSRLEDCSKESRAVTQMPTRDTALTRRNQELKNQAQEAQIENDLLKKELLKTKTELMSLRKFKTTIESMQEGDIIISLTQLVTQQKDKITGLELEINALQESTQATENDIQALSNQLLKRERKIEQLEIENQKLDSLNARFKEIIILLNVDPDNPILPLEENNSKPDSNQPAKQEDEEIDMEYIDRLIREQKRALEKKDN